MTEYDGRGRSGRGGTVIAVLTYRRAEDLVISEYEHAPEPWISAGRFFQRRRLATGTPLTLAATNNLLLRLPQIRASRSNSTNDSA